MASSVDLSLQKIKQQILERATGCGRNPSTILLIGVTKKKSIEDIEQAIQNNLNDFGENYAQEFLKKWEALSPLPLQWHFIGSLQQRKVKEIIGKISFIHSVDSFELALEINKRAQDKKLVQKCLLQINFLGETTKSGISKDKTPFLLNQINALKNIEIQGLMTLPPYFENPEKGRPYFRQLHELRDELNAAHIYAQPLTHLSMGMSHDFHIAIEEGATMLRIGTAIFGERK